LPAASKELHPNDRIAGIESYLVEGTFQEFHQPDVAAMCSVVE